MDDIDEKSLTKMDKFHLDLHRNSRLKLYERVSRLIDTLVKYSYKMIYFKFNTFCFFFISLFSKQMNGPECVKRALCETRRQRRDTKPDSFLIEIMRAVFTLPKALRMKRSPTIGANVEMQRAYDEAHFGFGDREDVECSAMFARCPGSVWSDSFRI